MTLYLTAEAAYRMQERLGILYGAGPVPPDVLEDYGNRAMRWQLKYDRESTREPLTFTGETKILPAV